MALYDIDSDCDDFIEHKEKSRNWRLCELLARANCLLGLNVLSNDYLKKNYNYLKQSYNETIQ